MVAPDPPTDKIRLVRQTWRELADTAGRNLLLIVPVGAIEQHGPHLPIETDASIAIGPPMRPARRFPVWSDG